MAEELENGSAGMSETTRRSVLAVIAILGLLMAGSWVVGGSQDHGGHGPQAAFGSNPGPSPQVSAARYLPSVPGAGFAVRDIDLAAWADPLGHVEDLMQAAMDDPAAPKSHVDEATSRTNAERRIAALATAAVTCLHQRGSRALHAYEDTAHPYSLAVVLIVDADTFEQVDVAGCALSDVSGAAPHGSAALTIPRLRPCSGLHRDGSTVIAWVGTTDWMCTALNQEHDAVALPARHRDLRQGDVGTDVAGVQFLLKQAGFVMTMDGVFGGDTSNAIRVFQRCHPQLTFSPEGIATRRTVDAVRRVRASGWTLDRCVA